MTKEIVDILGSFTLANKSDMLRKVYPLLDNLPNTTIKYLWENHAADQVFKEKKIIYQNMYNIVLNKIGSVADKKRREELHEYLHLLTTLAAEEASQKWNT